MDLLHLPKIVKIGKLVTNCEIIIFMRLSNLSESLIIKQNHLKTFKALHLYKISRFEISSIRVEYYDLYKAQI